MIILIEGRILVLTLPAQLIRLLERIGAKRTVLRHGEQVLAHLHRFMALYFTSEVHQLETRSGRHFLPHHAAVLVLPRTIHSWVGVQRGKTCAVVSHFHRGHPAHTIAAA